MGQQTSESTPKYDFSAEDIADATAGNTNAIVDREVDKRGGYWESEEDSETSLQANEVLEGEASEHAQKVTQGVTEMYEDAYAEHEQRSSGGEN